MFAISEALSAACCQHKALSPVALTVLIVYMFAVLSFTHKSCYALQQQHLQHLVHEPDYERRQTPLSNHHHHHYHSSKQRRSERPESASQHKCLPKCSCKWKSGKMTVECIETGFSVIPNGINSDTQVLHLTGNPLQRLPPKVFQKVGLTHLQRIFLNR